MSNSKQILIIGANFSNKGAEAMMKTVKQQLSMRHPDIICHMLCRPYEKQLAIENGFNPVFGLPPSPFQRQWRKFKYRLSGKLYKLIHGKSKPWRFAFPFEAIRVILNDLDAVIDISGFAYADSWGKPMIDETTKLLNLCKRRGIKFYFLPQAWGSFDIPEVSVSVKRMLDEADGFFARDQVSRRHLAKAMGVQESAIRLMPDIVFSFESDVIPVRTELTKYKAKGKLLIGISPNLRVYEKSSKQGTENSYISLLLTISRFCLEQLNANLVLIPNETFPETTRHRDDRHLCELLYQHIGQPERCFVVDRYASAEEIKSYIGEVDLLVSSRFHALIFGLLQRKPVLAISWSHKYRELFSLFELEEFVTESDAMAHSKLIIVQLKKLIDEHQAIIEKIDTSLPLLKSQVDDMFREISI